MQIPLRSDVEVGDLVRLDAGIGNAEGAGAARGGGIEVGDGGDNVGKIGVPDRAAEAGADDDVGAWQVFEINGRIPAIVG